MKKWKFRDSDFKQMSQAGVRDPCNVGDLCSDPQAVMLVALEVGLHGGCHLAGA